MITIEIDGKELQLEQGSMLIEAIDDAKIPLPRFCYHKKLSVAANCRMCLVEVVNAPKPLPACATPVTDGMKVFTKSKKARDAQQSVMEFLLINHPLDCPICDQGGECELQDVSMGYGSSHSLFDGNKRSVYDHDIGPLISTDLTRCILCTRCVRFGQEIAGEEELGDVGRGEHSEISTFLNKSVESELSGNVIDLCPVGALTSKPFRYKARAWELQQHPTIAAHDPLGTNIYMHSRRHQIMRTVPRDNDAINESWISNCDRFSYEALNHADRITKPLIKVENGWQEVSWEDALEFTSSGLKQFVAEFGSDKLMGLISPSSTTEEMYLLQKLLREMGCNNVDHRLSQTDFSDQDEFGDYPGLSDLNISDIENLDAILVIGANTRKQVPLFNHRIKKAAENNNAKVMFINPINIEHNFVVNNNIIAKNGDLISELDNQDVINNLKNAKNSLIIIGSWGNNADNAAEIRRHASELAKKTESKFALLSEGSNSAGAWLSGAVPHRTSAILETSSSGVNAKDCFIKKDINGFILFNVEPEFDCVASGRALQKINSSDLVIVFSPFVTERMKNYADVILPITPYTETSGTFVNMQGDWQSFQACVKPLGDARPGWKVLRALANFVDLPGFDYESSHEVRDQLQEKVEYAKKHSKGSWIAPSESKITDKNFVIIRQKNIYKTDLIVRRADALQKTADGKLTGAHFNKNTAKKLNLSVDAKMVEFSEVIGNSVMPFSINDNISDNVILIITGDNNSTNLDFNENITDICSKH